MKRVSTFFAALLLIVAVTFADAPFRNHRYDAFKVLPVTSEQTVFIGNSITNMHEWWEAFGDHNVVNRGVSGAVTDEALANVEAIAAGKPKKVFLMLGTNDLGTAGISTTEHVMRNVTLLVERFQKVSPTTQLYIQSILPSGHSGSGGTRTEALLKATNEALKVLCEEKEIIYIDLWNDLLDVATNSNGLSYDKLHLTASAYKIWCDKVAPYVTGVEGAKSVYTDAAQADGGLTGAYGMRATVFSKLPVVSDDILIIGDEMVHGGEWHELLQSARVKNRGTAWGYPGPSITDVQKMIPLILHDGARPSQVFLYTGVSAVNGTTDLNAIITDYKAVVAKIQELSPTTKVTLMSLQPTTDATKNTNRVVAFNALLEAYADTSEEIEYLDLYTDFVKDGVANTAYFSGNYLYGKGYVKVAQKIAAQVNALEPTASLTAITDAEAAALYTRFANRTALGNVLVQAASLPEGDGVGYYTTANLADVKAQVEAAYSALAGSTDAADVFTSQIASITEATSALLPKINQPIYSTEGTEVWYQLYTPHRDNRYLTSMGVGAGVMGEEKHNFATGMWKFVLREDGTTLDIINRHDNSYLSPTASYNTQLSTSASQPAKGWTLGHANTAGLFIVSSGTVQLNQTQSSLNYKVYNWSAGQDGTDRSDAGCQYQVVLVEGEPDTLPEVSSSVIEYTVDKAHGNLYRGSSANQAWNSVWRSTINPELQFGCGPNNMNWVDNHVQLMVGTAGNATYTLTAPAGYAITEYSFTFANNGHDTALDLTMDDGAAYRTSSTAQTISGSNLKVGSVSFVLAGSNGKGVVLTDFTVKVKEDVLEALQVSTEGDEHWYYITSASTKDYCKGKVIYYDGEMGKLRFGDKAFTADHIWSFWEQGGKLAIKNYRGEYFGTAGTGTGGTTSFGVVSEPNYTYTVSTAHDFYIIKDHAVELHAQEANQVIVRWGAEAGGASLWKFDEVNVSNAAAELAYTRVVQGKVSTGIGNTDQPIVRSTLRVGGLEGCIAFQGVKGRFSGTNPSDITNVKAYFATNARELFIDPAKKMPWREENGVQYGEAVALAEDGTFTITGTKELAPGDHHLWITYDIAETAKEGNLVDAVITSYTIGGSEVPESNGDPTHSLTIFLSEGAVLMPMDKGSLYYRIPSITVTKDGKRLVTLTDDRKGHNADLPSHCYLVAQYSEDNGKTWSDPVTVAGTAETGGNYGHGDASIVTNRDNGDIIGIMTSAGTYGHGFFAGTAAEPPRWKTITSHDGGLTWDAPVDHTDDLFGANCDNENTKTWKSGFSGSGAALQKRDGTLVSSFVNRQADNSQHFYFFMSKDGGKNWYVSGTSGTSGADEPKTLERNNGDLAISVRAGGYNYHNYTSDDGATWHLPSQTRFTTGISGNACDGEYMVWCSTLEGNPWDIALQTLPNSGSRQNVSIALSTDEGSTFGTPKTICPRGSAYSAAVVLPDGTLGVYYEENGVFGGYTMRFVRFSLDWASNGAYKFTDEAPFHPIKSTAATFIEEVQPSPLASNPVTYDLQGRRVDTPTKGLYIVGGRKVVIK